jgi:hypothetical protein
MALTLAGIYIRNHCDACQNKGYCFTLNNTLLIPLRVVCSVCKGTKPLHYIPWDDIHWKTLT